MWRWKFMPEQGTCFSMGYTTLSGPVAVEGERMETATRSLVGEKGKQKDEWDSTGHVALHNSREVASGSATQGLWLRNGKVRSQVSSVDQSRFPGRRTVWKIRRGRRRGRRTSNRAKKSIYSFRVWFGWKRRASHLPYLSLGNDWRGASRSGDASLAIFITSVSSSKSLASFTNPTFHLSRPPGFKMAFDAAKRNRRFGRIQCQRGKKSSSRGKRQIFLCRRTVRKSHPSKLSESWRKEDTHLGQKTGERGTDRRIGRWSVPRSWSTSQKQERAREEGAKEMSGEWLPVKWCRRVRVSGSFRGKKSEQMTQSNTSSPWDWKYLLTPKRGDGNWSPPEWRDFWREEWREKRSRFCHLLERSK